MSSMCLEFTIKNILPKGIGLDLWLMELYESIYHNTMLATSTLTILVSEMLKTFKEHDFVKENR
jgi:hypothetical protein